MLEIHKVNVEALDAALREALGAVVVGVNHAPPKVVVYLDDQALRAEVEEARAIVAAHNPNAQTPAQQARAAAALKLAAARRDYAQSDLELAGYEAQTAPVRALAQKVAWLEQEIRALVGKR